MIKVLSVSSSRADVGILSSVWSALNETGKVDLHVFFTGMHMALEAVDQSNSVPAGATIHRGGVDLGGADGILAADAMGRIVSAAAKVLGDANPDVLLVTGDRLDMIPTAMAALPMGVPIVHLHGGEITEGAVDDCVRRALSQISDFHCVANEQAKHNLMAMGVDNAKITITGAPGLDTLKSVKIVDADKFAQTVGLPVGLPFKLVTLHPETKADNPLAPVNAALEALKARPGPVLFTAPNSDPGGAEARRRILEFCSTFNNSVFVETLDSLYPSALRHAHLMIGNSSSGVIEAGLFGLPVINIGDRQKGRLHGSNVVSLPSDPNLIVEAFDQIQLNSSRVLSDTPYGNGTAAPRVASLILSVFSPSISL